MNRLAAASSQQQRFRTWPITAARSIEPQLRQMGLNIPAERIDGTTTASSSSSDKRHLSDALVSIGASGKGGTGSFVSKNGLILTNWHVAHDAVRQASLLAATNTNQDDVDYVKNGFVSKCYEDEIRGPNYEVWITKSCTDVSEQVVKVLSSEKDPLQRANRVRDVMQDIAQTAQKQQETDNNNSVDGAIRCDVQEMLPNESYVLFTYERIRDVRIVYVPPKSLGNFGGDVDNFEWPRHTADFTLLRAYVSPNNGGAAEYSPNNIPYQPKTWLPVQKEGAAEGDFVFLLGFPGRTMRYAPSARLSYSNNVAVPHMIQNFSRKLQLIEQYESDSPEAALKLSNSKKSLANEYKRSQGKMIMMQKLGLIEERREEERILLLSSSQAPAVKSALGRLQEIYDEFRDRNSVATTLETCRGIYAGSTLLAVGHAVQEFCNQEQRKPDQEREASYRERNLSFLCKRLGKRIGDIHIPHEAALLQDAIDKLSKTSDLDVLHQKVLGVFFGDNYLESIVKNSKLRDLDGEKLESILKEVSESESQKSLLKDPFVHCAEILYKTYEAERDRSKALMSERDELFATLLEVQRQISSGDEVMYPDCNGSLRISAGHVEGYQAADAVEFKPQTTLAGLLDKVIEAKLSADSSRMDKFHCPDRLYQMLENDHNACKEVPVCLLYSTDTVGGNSGSPVMNADGELVGINFDRQRQGLMNEFKWSKNYSRSIGVDIRYMLWLMGDYDGAANLVDELLDDEQEELNELFDILQ